MEAISTAKLITKVPLIGAILLLGFLLLTTQIGTSQARSLSTNDDFFSDPIVKRNTWWSKKSLDALNTVQHEDLQSNDDQTDKYTAVLEVYECYVQKCVQSFVLCARESASEELFNACEVLHKLCAASCSNSSNRNLAL